MVTKEITIRVEVQVCQFCGYEWKPKVASPKECPRCKQNPNRKRQRYLKPRKVVE